MKKADSIPSPEVDPNNRPVQKEAAESEERELTEDEALFLREKIRPVKIIEFVFLMMLFGAVLYIYVYVYDQPFPYFLKVLLGIDDCVYPEQLQRHHRTTD